jgi:hypothetical protein
VIAIFSQIDFINALPNVPSGTLLGKPLVAVDGRVAIDHAFTDDDQAYLTQNGATLCDVMPADFVNAEVTG